MGERGFETLRISFCLEIKLVVCEIEIMAFMFFFFFFFQKTDNYQLKKTSLVCLLSVNRTDTGVRILCKCKRRLLSFFVSRWTVAVFFGISKAFGMV